MKKGFALAVCMLLFPFAVFGMQPMTEPEMDAVKAQSGVLQEGDMKESPLFNDKGLGTEFTIQTSGNQLDMLSDTASGATIDTKNSSGAGVAIFIDDVKIFFGGPSETWYQTSGRPD